MRLRPVCPTQESADLNESGGYEVDQNRYVIGVDGGNTKTAAVVVDGAGTVVGVGEGGCTDIYGVASPPDALAELDRVVARALQHADCDPADLRAGVFSLAGADWPEHHDYLRRHLEDCRFGFDAVVINDSIGGLRLGARNGRGSRSFAERATRSGPSGATAPTSISASGPTPWARAR